MILSLDIKNIALIKNTTINLTEGLNVLTGETGAGKSIIIDSLKFVLGDRADRGLIRHNEDHAKVTVSFSNDDISAVNDILDAYGIDKEETIIISRMMNTNGKSEVRINGNIVNLSVVKKIVEILIDVHAQHENTSLFNSSKHITILDNFNKDIIKNLLIYKSFYAKYYEIVDKLEHFSSESERERKIELLNYQINEINDAKIEDGEEEILVQKRHKLLNIQKYLENLNNIYDYIEGKNNLGISNLLHFIGKELQLAMRYDDSLDKIYERIESVKIEVSDIKDEISSKLDFNGDEENLEIIERRINLIRSIKRKYGSNCEEINSFLLNAIKDREELANAAEEIEQLKDNQLEIKKNLIDIAMLLHNLRITNGELLSNLIEQNLKDLGMSNSKFFIDCQFDKENIIDNLNPNGADEVQFLISPNLGEPLKPLSKIASGGEISRFMLALKNIIAKQNDTQTLVFDEIDTGISGNIANVVAKKLFDIAKYRQVIVITHLPQICAMADTQFHIFKETTGNSTVTSVKKLNQNEMLNEIMRLAGATDNLELGLSHAKELKRLANKYKEENR